MSFLETAMETAIVFSAVDHFSGPVRSMAGSLGILDEQTRAVQQRMNEFKNMTFVGGAITMVGMKLAGAMENGLDQAGAFLTKMTMIKDVTGATADQMKRIQDTIQSSSGKTIFGVQDTASFAQLLATSGLTANQTSGLLPLFTQFAEVQKLGKGMDPTEAIQQAIQGAHAVGAYDPKQLSEFLNQYNKASFMTPGSTTELANTFKYLAPKGAGIGMTSDDMLFTSALANRMGLAGSMGGTNAADMILRAIPGLFKGKAQPAALKTLGINAYDANGNFKGIADFIKQLQEAAVKIPNGADRAKLFHAAFGQQGMGFANLLASPRGMEQLTALVDQMNGVKPISGMQHDINQTPEGQRLQLQTNIENLKLDVWLELAKLLNPMFKDLNGIVSNIQEFAKAHPEVAKMAAEFMSFATAAALIIGPLLLITGVLGYLKEAQYVSTGFKLLGLAVKGSVGPVLGLLAAGYFLYQAWTNDWGGIKEKTKAVLDWFKQEIPKAISNAKDFAKDIGLMSQDGKLEMPGWLKFLIEGLGAAKLAAIAFNLVAMANPWVLAIGLISLAVIGLITHWNDVKRVFVEVKNTIIEGINWCIDKINDFIGILDMIPGVKVPLIAHLSLDTSLNDDAKGWQLARNANGTDYWRGGLTWVGENGPEIINAPRGSQIIPNHKLSDIVPARTRSGGSYVSVEKGAIVINTQPGQSPDEIADAVIRKLGTSTRSKNLSRSMTPNRLVFG